MTHSDRAFIHSFPRYASGQGLAAERAKGRATLLSIFELGLLLTPEVIRYPNLEDDTGRNDTLVYQRRFCLNFLRRPDLPAHQAVFGMYSLEFDERSVRAMGAVPVIYVPQPVDDGDSGRNFSIFANQLVHQLRDTSVLLDELTELEKALKKAKASHWSSAEARFRDECTPVDVPSLEAFLSYLIGMKGSFSDLSQYISAMSNLFYHTDSARLQTYMMGADLRYYLQNEWRVISGMQVRDARLDEDIDEFQRQHLVELDSFFAGEVVLKDGSRSLRAQAATAIASLSGFPVWHHLTRIYVPDCEVEWVRQALTERGVEVPVVAVDYEMILEYRAGKVKRMGMEHDNKASFRT